MKKKINIKIYSKLSLLVILTSLAMACSSEDMPIQHADDYGYITFSMKAEKVNSRTNPYEAYSPTKHPGTMGVFGYHDLPTQNVIFNNEVTTYDAASANWQTAPLKKWKDYSSAKAFDFFAYMPQKAGAKVTHQTSNAAGSANTESYTLSIPFSMPTGSCFLTDSKQAPIICALPDHKQATTADGKELSFDRVVKMQFDQTLTAYQLLFMLDSKMNAIRQFSIKNVTISGNIAISGNIQRTYTWNQTEWAAGAIEWADIQRLSDTDTPIALSPTQEPITITSKDYTQWGETIYMIPDAQWEPTLSVTYDVELVKEDGNTIVTRKDVTSSIIINKTNFSSLTQGGIATINPIRILVQPRYLYVLADDDAYTGHLLIE